MGDPVLTPDELDEIRQFAAGDTDDSTDWMTLTGFFSTPMLTSDGSGGWISASGSQTTFKCSLEPATEEEAQIVADRVGNRQVLALLCPALTDIRPGQTVTLTGGDLAGPVTFQVEGVTILGAFEVLRRFVGVKISGGE